MEMECMFWGESENAFFKLDDIQKCRTLLKPFYPTDHVKFLENKAKNKKIKSNKQNGEIRIVSIDVAMMGGDKNDNTIISCIRMLPNRNEYIKNVTYIESINGQHSEIQAIRLKQIFYDFEADYVCMDTAGNGLSIFDDCSRILYDNERDIEYPAWTAMNNEEMKNRSLEENALPIIFSVKVVSQQINHEIAMYLKTCFEKEKIKLLVNEMQGKDFLSNNNKDFSKLPMEEQIRLEIPYVQTTLLVNELVNLEYEIRNGFVKLKETGTKRKDRYSSLGYGIYLSKLLEQDMKQEKDNIDASQYCFIN